MTKISKGEDLPDSGQTGQAGPVPLDIPGVGKSSGAGTDTGSAAGSGSGSGTGSAAGRGADSGSAAGSGSGSAAGGAPAVGAGSPGEDLARPPRRVDAADGGWWAELIVPSPEAPGPEAAAAAGLLAGEFEPLVYTGRDDAKFAMEEKPPPGYVLVEYAWKGRFFSLHSIDWNGREAVSLGGAHVPRGSGRRVMWCDSLYPLRFAVSCGDHDDWVVVVRPVSGVRELGRGATGRGSDVLLHTGPAAELVSRLRPAKEQGSLSVRGHGPRRPGAPAPFPHTLASGYDRSPKDRRALPEGPLFVEVAEAWGDWSLEVRDPGEAPPAEEKRPGFWSRLFGR
ncbi:hypothetical protein AB0E83_24120 [Streptomyces sp. NPDC035033]|uniref:hypothetical protein n=1 Tax=Streptomyces sp. NPDC035033 TaxID=3155368 RepID=UPI0033C4419C